MTTGTTTTTVSATTDTVGLQLHRTTLTAAEELIEAHVNAVERKLVERIEMQAIENKKALDTLTAKLNLVW
jgi:hypothetical protein